MARAVEQEVEQEVVAFITRYRAAILWCIYSLAIPGSDRKDVFQDVCVRILMRFRRHGGLGLRPDLESSGYAVAITRYVCLDHFRRRRRRPRSSGDEAPLQLLVDPAAMGADEVLDQAQAHHRLHMAVAQLPPLCRAVQAELLRGLTIKEVADHFDISEGNARVIAHRARALLRRRLRKP